MSTTIVIGESGINATLLNLGADGFFVVQDELASDGEVALEVDSPFQINSFSDATPGLGAYLDLYRRDGTKTSPGDVDPTDELGAIRFFGMDVGAKTLYALLKAGVASGDQDAGEVTLKIRKADGSLLTALTVSEAGNFVIDSSLTLSAGNIEGIDLFLSGDITQTGIGTNSLTGPLVLSSFLYIQGLLRLLQSESTLNADQNNFDLNNKSIQAITPSGATRTFTGFAVGTNTGSIIWILNVSASQDLVLANESASSTAANRIITQSGANLTIKPKGAVCLWYDSTAARWRVVTALNTTAPIYTSSILSATGTEAIAVASSGQVDFTVGAQRKAGGAASLDAQIGGVISTNIVAVGNDGGGEDDLHSHTLPANLLATNGDTVEFDFGGTLDPGLSANLNIRVYFGATLLGDLTGLSGIEATSWRAHGRIIRTGAATQIAICTIQSNALAAEDRSVTSHTTPAETLSGAIVLKATGQTDDTTDDRVVQTMSVVKWYPVAA